MVHVASKPVEDGALPHMGLMAISEATSVLVDELIKSIRKRTKSVRACHAERKPTFEKRVSKLVSTGLGEEQGEHLKRCSIKSSASRAAIDGAGRCDGRDGVSGGHEYGAELSIRCRRFGRWRRYERLNQFVHIRRLVLWSSVRRQ